MLTSGREDFFDDEPSELGIDVVDVDACASDGGFGRVGVVILVALLEVFDGVRVEVVPDDEDTFVGDGEKAFSL